MCIAMHIHMLASMHVIIMDVIITTTITVVITTNTIIKVAIIKLYLHICLQH